jgi:glutamate racemase
MPVIGVFDSGFGGLTVLRALLPLIPNAHYIYLGDTARLPYGAKSQATIARYAVESARFLADQGCDHLVIACNTATALALPEIKAAVAIPVIGVIEPVVAAAHAALLRATPTPTQDPSSQPSSAPVSTNRPPDHDLPTPQILVLATNATVQSHAYFQASQNHHLHATEKATPLLVPLIEEGWTNHPVTRQVLSIYLAEALGTCTPQAILLGCTHYPLIASEIESTLRKLNSSATIIDSAQATAAAVAQQVAQANPPSTPHRPATFLCYATDSTEKFRRLGSTFLGQPIPSVNLLDLGG